MGSRVFPTFFWPLIRPTSHKCGNFQFRTSKITFTANQTRVFTSEEIKEKNKSEVSENEKKLTSEIEFLTKEIRNLEKNHEEILDKYKRALAENENLRNRLTKQIQDAKLFGIQGFCKDLLEVADILEQATKSVPKDEISDKNPHLKNLYEGLSITQKSLEQAFKRHGLQKVDPLNEKFDPNIHEALYQKEVEGAEPNIVIEVNKIGYKLHERCIRPALVGVSKGS